ncbi:MAG TPA: DUF4126 family protein [Mycobacteriales bacterium]|jgi:uncharacterized membrane protein|nr:DUF4126 family protein [Mycobacteriales bacterium]
MTDLAPAALLRPLLLGVVTGSRSQLGLAVLAWAVPPDRSDPRALRVLRSRAGRLALGAAAAGEVVADKLPRTPSRTSPPALAGRLVSGALVGALAAGRADRRGTALAATAGVLGAAAGSYAGAAYRRAAAARTGTPDLPWALVEDAAAAGLAAAALRAPAPTPPWWRRLPLLHR